MNEWQEQVFEAEPRSLAVVREVGLMNLYKRGFPCERGGLAGAG
jgi:hypothetical protein